VAGCSAVCENVPITTLRSPGDSHTAIVFRRDCGATTGFNTHVSLVPGQADNADGGGNVWVADDSGAVRRGAWGGPDVALSWAAPDTLVVRYPIGTRVFKAEDSVEGVAVRYVIQ
jgi:hypothetical protein